MNQTPAVAWMEPLTFSSYIHRTAVRWPPTNPYHVTVFDANGDVVLDQLKNLAKIEPEHREDVMPDG